MRGEYNGLKALILKKNPSVYYIHCFAHQLQLALVAVAQKHPKIEKFFTTVHKLVNILGGSAKRSDLIRVNQRLKILESLSVVNIIEMIATDTTSTRTRSDACRLRRETVTNLHHFRVEMFYAVIDMQLQEFNDRFFEVNSNLLLCVACLSPNNSFAAFDKTNVLRLCQYYPIDFDSVDISKLDD
ncbi:uncharacterized protein LOC111408630 [Olea europaea var. sylvestris]|uniref:uncharacterized protein LOC111408630 n=1 Tax=Olea europaea var. sylvestris TaxID=158386 RepID=UPI000C1D1909|nr:uncharacterized protein LOC111408630 [Olea europaea var. sylvestris]